MRKPNGRRALDSLNVGPTQRGDVPDTLCYVRRLTSQDTTVKLATVIKMQTDRVFGPYGISYRHPTRSAAATLPFESMVCALIFLDNVLTKEMGGPRESVWWWLASGRTEVILLSAGLDVDVPVSVLVRHRRRGKYEKGGQKRATSPLSHG